jgi:nicotinamide-nucleotide amidase
MAPQLIELAAQCGLWLQTRGLRLATAESCTGGLIAAAITEIAGSSAWFERGFVTYSNEAKMELLGVQAATLAQHGAVSEATVREMAAGALAHSHADIALAVSGIAGPGGGTPDKPVGTVCLAWAWRDGSLHSERQVFSGDRAAVRQQTCLRALQEIISLKI